MLRLHSTGGAAAGGGQQQQQSRLPSPSRHRALAPAAPRALAAAGNANAAAAPPRPRPTPQPRGPPPTRNRADRADGVAEHAQPVGRAQVEAAEARKLADAEAAAGPEKAKALKLAVFSAQNYVVDHFGPPLTSHFPQTKFIDARLDADTAALAEGCGAVCIFVNDDASAPVIATLARCGVRMIALRCAGYDRVDLAACAAHGIAVARVPTYSPTSVAEMAVALAFALNRNLHLIPARVAQGNYALSGLVGFEMCSQTVAVLGTGAIGAEACRIFRGIGMRVLAYDVRPNPAVEAMGVEYCSVDEMLPQADVVSLHLPLLPSTTNFFDAAMVAKLKPNALLINVSRGGLVDTDALLAGLESGQIGGLGLDVYANEGALFFTDWSSMDAARRMKSWDRRFKTLISYPQVFVTPHSAFLTHEALRSIGRTTAINLLEFVAGKEVLTNAVKA